MLNLLFLILSLAHIQDRFSESMKTVVCVHEVVVNSPICLSLYLQTEIKVLERAVCWKCSYRECVSTAFLKFIKGPSQHNFRA